MNRDYHLQARTTLVHITPLPQIVPRQICFRCDVCCRFPEPDSFLRPYFTADRMVPWAAQTLFRRSCQEAAQRGYTFINTMDAFGLPSLARSRHLYRPVSLVASYSATESS